MNAGIAIVGMACCYADARNPQELWENVLAKRRAFRRLPAERLSLQDYFSADPAIADSIYASEAALIEGYQFDRVRFRVAGPIFRSVDMAHWLALDVADQALRDAGFTDGNGLPRETTGVLVGNTLTGEFSRAATLRLRWPYVRRVVEARLREEGWEEKRRGTFLGELEKDYKAPFAPVSEETLAGALSNTIPGRICNYFHFGGGGYTVDGACCSSLLAVARACAALETGEIDAALAGGVDLSLDPFELVGFAKAGALARGEMRVYDRESSGFLPGEGSGFVVLMRAEDAAAQKLRSYAVIRGCGVSSDGAGSITRPDIRGQMLALERAYRHAGYGVETVALFEGHGTGTPVGDEVELQAIMQARNTASDATRAAAIGSIKANIGHTKAAAGVAGLMKAVMAVHQQTLPPTTGVPNPRAELEVDGASLRVLDSGELWPEELPLRAGISSFGFGGINVHVTIEGNYRKRTSFSPKERVLLSSAQDAELFLLDADDAVYLAQKAASLAGEAERFSYTDMADVSTALAEQTNSRQWRAAVVARTPVELADRLRSVRELLHRGARDRFDPNSGVFVGAPAASPRIAFLFPGQASPVRLRAGIYERRFPEIRELYSATNLPSNEDIESTHVAQLAIATSELAGLRLLSTMGIEASASLGHSLGELVAYCWAGALDDASLLRLVDIRGRLMAELPGPAGAMANIYASPEAVRELIQGEAVVLACFNAQNQTVVAGPSDAIATVVSRAQSSGHNATILPAAHAFHSPLMSPAVPQLQAAIRALSLSSLSRRVVSTITGDELPPTANLGELLAKQLTAPVRFLQALQLLEKESDLYIEVGPGRILTHLVTGFSDVPAIALDSGSPSLAGVLQTAAAAYVKGAPLRLAALFGNRFTRPFQLGRPLRFFANPCESAPIHATNGNKGPQTPAHRNGWPKIERQEQSSCAVAAGVSAEQVVQALVARRTELPPASVQASARLLRDLHLNSIVVAEIVATAARELGIAPPRRPLDFADATVGELAKALERLSRTAPRFTPQQEAAPAGIDHWVRAFLVEWAPSTLRRRSEPRSSPGIWKVIAGHPELDRLSQAEFPGNGVIVCLSSQRVEDQAGLLLQGAHAALRNTEGKRHFVVAGPAASMASAFSRTLHLENPDILTRVVEAPVDSDLSEYILQEIGGASGHMDARYDAAGQRWQPGFRLLCEVEGERIPIAPDEVILVTGGGKGIVAECAAALTQDTEARLVILGRSRPEDSLEVAEQLEKLAAQGAQVKYVRTDVADLEAVRAAVREVESNFGRITAVVHGAGCNEPVLVRDLDEAKLRRALAPKVEGLRNLIDAVDGGRLRLLVTFGSVIGRVGLRGESHYALANACLASLTEEFARQHPACRCLVFESSAWSGVGMAERLGTIEALRRDGIAAITPKEGVAWFRRLVAGKLPAPSVVVTGRLGAASPLPIQAAPLPMLRFLERPLVHYPGVELVVQSDLTTASDPYLLEHVFQHEPLLPGVMGLEAMAQAAMAVAGEERLPLMEDVRFEQSVVVEPRSRVTLQIAALAREPGLVEVALRSSQTSFAIDHFRCVCRFTDSQLPSTRLAPLPDSHRLPVEPEKDLYGALMFQSGRFRRLAGYHGLGSQFSIAEIVPADTRNWFSRYLPQTLVLGDPAARDAAVHSIQACVPHALLLPVAVERVVTGKLNPQEKLFAHARERWQEGTAYCYDLELRSADGALRELWEGLTLRKVADARIADYPDPLVAASLEWRSREMTRINGLGVAFERDSTADRRTRSERAIQKALGSRQPVRWRSDGKPEVDSKMSVSAAHMDGLTLAVAGPQLVTCDLEPVRQRADQVWCDLLGLEGWNLAKLMAHRSGEDLQTTATRVWTALESLKKAAKEQDGQVVLMPGSWQDQGCVALAVGGLKISSTVVRLRDNPLPVAVSILTGSKECIPTSTGTESALKKRIS